MSHVDKLWCRSKYPNVAASVYDSSHDAISFQRLNGAIDRETFRDPPKVDNQRLAESNVALLFQNNVAPTATAKTHIRSRKIIPVHQLPGRRDVENAIAVARKFMRAFQNTRRRGMNTHRFVKRVAIHARNVAFRVVKTH